MGTKSGQIFGLPCLAEIGQSYFILQDKCSEYSVESIILNQRLLIVSCADGTLVIY